MFKFKGISSEDMQVIIEEEEHFIARAAQRFEMTEIEGKDGAQFDELGYSPVERPIRVQCLNVNKIDDILAWLNGVGEFEYKGRKTIARFYSQAEPERVSCIRIIDMTFIRDPFWYKANEEYETIKDRKDRTTEIEESLEITDCAGIRSKLDIKSGKSKQATRDGKNLINIYNQYSLATNVSIDDDDWITITADRTNESTIGYSNFFFKPNFDLETGKYYYWVLEVKSVSTQLGESSASNIRVVDTTTTNKGQFASNWAITLNQLNTADVKIQRVITRDSFDGCTTFSRSYVACAAGDKISITFRLSVLEVQPTVETFEYEAYGVSPSPIYPSNIKNVGSDVNLFELNNTKYPIDTDSTITHTFSNETVTLNGSLTSKKDTYLIGKNSTTNYICTLKPNTTYTILIEIVSGSFTGANQWILRANGARNYQVGSLLQPDYYDNKSIKTFTTGDTEINIMSVLLYNNDASVSYKNLKFRIKLVEGSDISAYTFYNQSSVNVKTESKNKFAGWTKQCYINSTNGVIGRSTSGMASKLCEIEPNTPYRMSGIAQGSYGKNKFISYYRADKSYISRTGSSNVSSITNTTPADAKYCALGIAGAFADTTEMDNFIADSSQIQLEKGANRTSYQEYGKTEIQFPFVEGQVLHQGDYLAEDGIHQVRKTVVFDGSSDETWDIRNDTHEMRINLGTDAIYNSQILANQLKQVSAYSTTGDNIRWVSNSTIICISSSTLDTANMTLAQWKEYLQSNNLILEYGIEEIVIPYTVTQQEAYDEIQNLLLYEGYNLITTANEIKPDIQATYFIPTTETIDNEGNYISKPVLKLEKTIAEKVELTVNDIRFGYDFKNDDYVEIDCEEKSVKYNGLNRNRQITIGYKFPKLNVGSNDIKMHKNDCIIKTIRKDRWL